MNDVPSSWVLDLKRFEIEAAEILGKGDGAVAPRAFNAHEALKKVSALSVDQSDLLKQSVRCIEVEVFRAAIVMAWAAIADLVLELAVVHMERIKEMRTWKYQDKSSLGEEQAEYNIIEALHKVGVFTKGQKKSLHGMLHRRNECAHPSGYFPGPNESLGFLDEAINFAEALSKMLLVDAGGPSDSET